jgi:heme-degrading monooxygenase HmoA
VSVIMTLRVKGDPAKLERLAAEDPDRLPAIVEKAKEHGVIAHRFYATDDGTMMVVDEWPDRESFQAFFEGSQDQIGSVMSDAGVTEEPEITFWRKLETNDEIGWGA